MISEYLEAGPAKRLALFIKNRGLLSIVEQDDVILKGCVVNKYVEIRNEKGKKEIIFAIYFSSGDDETAYSVCTLRPKSMKIRQLWMKLIHATYSLKELRENIDHLEQPIYDMYDIIGIDNFIELIFQYKMCFVICYESQVHLYLPVSHYRTTVGRGRGHTPMMILVHPVFCKSRSPPLKTCYYI